MGNFPGGSVHNHLSGVASFDHGDFVPLSVTEGPGHCQHLSVKRESTNALFCIKLGASLLHPRETKKSLLRATNPIKF